MGSFEELPVDITFNIIEWLNDDTRSLCDLRLVSKSFNRLATCFLFSNFSFTPSNDDLEKCHSLISESLMQKTSVFIPTRELHIKMGIWWDPFEEELAKPWFELWNVMLPTMTNLRILEPLFILFPIGVCSWGYWLPQSCPPELVNGFLKSLGSLKSLTDLTISFHSDHPTPTLSLEPISGLKRLSIRWCLYRGLGKELIEQIASLLARCPDLEVFEFSLDIQISSYRNIKPAITLKELFEGLHMRGAPLKLRRLKTRGVVVYPEDFLTHLPHLKSLEQLEVVLDPSPTASDYMGEICAILRREGIHIQAFSTSTLHHPEIIRYLSSFNTLNRFSLQSFDQLDDSLALIDRFFSTLTRHHRSLKMLRLDVNRKSPWPQALKSHLQKEAGLYRSLHSLCSRVYVSQEEIISDNTRPLHTWLDIASTLPSLRHLECPYVSYKTGSYYFKRDSDDLIERRAHSPCIHGFVQKIVVNGSKEAESVNRP
ncbi:hypothetical protein NP233_g742 [Leucocoprinus birnbaumii]|uniref:F-box domain-containing protein n=1 Tax=Leucocoprinus birnbaumii TaxID=56174 RepID=A0AAD5W542_9AGAR|nr:hypothetical protein NP233_g742 [Leucocoprinus birnbaumii]